MIIRVILCSSALHLLFQVQEHCDINMKQNIYSTFVKSIKNGKLPSK